MKYNVRTLSRMVYAEEHEDPYEFGFIITVVDEGNGEFIKIHRGEHEMLAVDKEEWLALSTTVDLMMEGIKDG